MSDDRTKRFKRRQNRRSHIAGSLRNPINRQRIKPSKVEDDAERRFRRYRDLREIGLDEEGNET